VINGRNLQKTPPINDLRIASGQYQIDVVCSNGQTKSQLTTIFPGQTSTAVVQ